MPLSGRLLQSTTKDPQRLEEVWVITNPSQGTNRWVTVSNIPYFEILW
jgi:hypothetical protein